MLHEGSDGRTVVLCHPAPGSGQFDPDPARTVARDLTLISVDRPGYGDSDPRKVNEWATVSDSADDLADVLDQLGTGPAGLAGWGAGGRVAMALCARRPDLVDRIVLLGTPAPDKNVPWLPDSWREALSDVGGSPSAARSALDAVFAESAATDPHAKAALDVFGAGAADEEAVNEAGERLGDMLAAAYAQGTIGLASDVAGFCLRPWGFDPPEVTAKVLCLYGAHDPFAGTRHGRWWQEHLPTARLEASPKRGPLLIVGLWDRVLSHLAPRRR
jgi:pimeloyl-ACP methyl ester carboxylesterase